MSEKITSGQSLAFGGQVANILHDLRVDKGETQFALESQGHPVWEKLTVILTESLIKEEKVAEQVKEAIIEWTADLTIPAQPEFVVADHFTKPNPNNIEFWNFGENFRNWFMPLTEKAVEESIVGIGKLRIPAKFAEMTPEQPAPRIVTMSQICWMILQQPKGEKPNGRNRKLLVNGYADLFCAFDKDGIERAVEIFWIDSFGWNIDGEVLEHDIQWCAGRQVISRKSDLKTLEPLAPAA